MFVPDERWHELSIEALGLSPLATTLCLAGLIYCFYAEPRSWRWLWWPGWATAAASVLLLLASLILAYSSQTIPFLYFQF
jgi:hypothetical protein